MTEKKRRTPKTPRVQRCYYCNKELSDEDLVIKPFPLRTKRGKRMYKRKFHYKCLPKYIEEHGNVINREQEDSDWDKVYKYFQHEILRQKSGNNLPQHAVERLLGLRVGRYKPNATNTRTIKQGYSFPVILNTMKFSKREIDKAIKRVNFRDEEHEINYIMKIIQGHLPFIQAKMNRLEKQNQRIEKLRKEDSTTNHGVEYQHKGTGRRKVELV